ncbi:MAG TPA: hypothetical protein VGS98_09150 [Thermoanaerobaculia bacterium]|jgi:hypothetical protein|nr:hypothetical protein [Thermoanaerobaculia bacterium]
MRLPERRIASLLAGFLLATAGLAQAPPPAQPPPRPPQPAPQAPQREIPGGAIVVAPPQETTVISQARPTVEAAPQPLGYESDLHCFGYLGQPNESFPAQVIGAESIAEQIDYMTSDLLYINGGYDRGLKVGDEFWLVSPEQMVVHPVTGKDLGRFYEYRGRAVVESVEPRTASIRISGACTDIVMGSYLKPFEPIPIPLARKSAPAVAGDPPSGKVRGRIVFTRDGIVAVGADHTIIVDLGYANGIEPGDFLTIYRYAAGREYGIRPVGAYWVTVPPPAGVSIPRTYLGEVAILAVGDRWSIGRVSDSYRLIEVGDEVELK